MARRYILALLTNMAIFQGIAQPPKYNAKYFSIDQECPDFALRNITNFYETKFTRNQIGKKWIILDLWDKSCGSCIAAFKGYDSIQRVMGDKLQFILAAKEDNKTKQIYKKYKDQERLIVPCAFDSAFFHRFDVNTSPYAIVIDPQGVVKAITAFLSFQNIEDLLSGKRPDLLRVYREHEIREKVPYDVSVPLLVNGNGGPDSDFVYRTLLAKFNPLGPINFPRSIWNKVTPDSPLGKITPSMASKINATEESKFEVMGATLSDLYWYAYLGYIPYPQYGDSIYGKIWPNILLEITDSAVFQVDEFYSSKNRFSYSQILPVDHDTKDDRMKTMQRELGNYFRFHVHWEIRSMPCWSLIVSDSAKLRLQTLGGVPYATPDNKDYKGTFLIKNEPISLLMGTYLIYSHGQYPPFFDETDINTNIDLTLNYGLFPTFSKVREVLKENGLDLIQGEREIKVLIVSDEINNN